MLEIRKYFWIHDSMKVLPNREEVKALMRACLKLFYWDCFLLIHLVLLFLGMVLNTQADQFQLLGLISIFPVKKLNLGSGFLRSGCPGQECLEASGTWAWPAEQSLPGWAVSSQPQRPLALQADLPPCTCWVREADPKRPPEIVSWWGQGHATSCFLSKEQLELLAPVLGNDNYMFQVQSKILWNIY